MSVEYTPNDEMTQAVSDLIGNADYEEFAPIREQELLFMVASMVKMDKDGGALPTAGEPVIVRRVGAADAVFIQGHFKVYVCNTRWDEAGETQRKAMLHRALMRVEVDKGEKSIKIGMRKPDVCTFQQTIVRFGAWDNDLIVLRNNLQNAQRKTKEPPSETGGKSK